MAGANPGIASSQAGNLFTSSDGSIAIDGGPARGQIDFRAVGGGTASWFATVQAHLFAKVPGLTQFTPWKAGVSYLSGIPTGAGNDGGLEGGAIISPTATVQPLSSVTTTQNGKTKPWALVLRGMFDPVGAGQQEIGLINAAGLHSCGLALASGLDATRLVLSTAAGGTVNLPINVADALIHDYYLYFDPLAALITAEIDTVVVGTQANLAQLPAEPLKPFIYGTNPTFFRAIQGGWAYALP